MMNEIKRFDENGDITKEWKEYVENLSREDLETFFIGADALCRRRGKAIKEALETLTKDENEAPIEVILQDVFEAVETLRGADEDEQN